MSYYVYLIGGFKKNKFKTYVGYTKNLKKRLFKHNSGKGAKSTRGYKWKFFYYKKYSFKKQAMSQEYFLKKNKLERKKIVNKFVH